MKIEALVQQLYKCLLFTMIGKQDICRNATYLRKNNKIIATVNEASERA